MLMKNLGILTVAVPGARTLQSLVLMLTPFCVQGVKVGTSSLSTLLTTPHAGYASVAMRIQAWLSLLWWKDFLERSRHFMRMTG